jgi:hypothetical protein
MLQTSSSSFEWDPVPSRTLSILQRAISTLSVTITSAVIMVAGKRYVLFKLARGGIRSRRVAVYSYPSIGNLAHYLALHGFELPLRALSALGLATGLTINDAWAMVPDVQWMPIRVSFGPFDAPTALGSLLVPAWMTRSWLQGGPMGVFFYPPLLSYIPNGDFSLSTPLNGFNWSHFPPSLPTARNSPALVTQDLVSRTGQLWYEGGDNETLSIIATLLDSQSLYRFNASTIVLGGTWRSTSNATEFAPNGETWPNVMSNDRWAQDIASLVCNATYPAAGRCTGGSSPLDFAYMLNAEYYAFSDFGTDSPTAAGTYWSTALGMAMGLQFYYIGGHGPRYAKRVRHAQRCLAVYATLRGLRAHRQRRGVGRHAGRRGEIAHGEPSRRRFYECHPPVAGPVEEAKVVRRVFGYDRKRTCELEPVHAGE